jgi:molecular chaperone GrpE
VSEADSKHDSPSAAPPPIAMPADEPATGEVLDPLAAMQAERDKFKDQLLRTAADFEIFRKRSRKDVEEAERRGKEDAVRELLPVIDNLERAVAAAAAAKDIAAVIDGVKMVLRLFEDQASRLGLARVPTVGERFDPSIHDAIQHKETDDSPAGTVVAEIVAGWRLGEKLVRPAMVVVAKKPTASA